MTLISCNGGLFESSRDAPRLGSGVAIVGLEGVIMLRGLLVDLCSTRIPGSLVGGNSGVVGAVAARPGTADKGVEVFEVEIVRSDRDGL